MADDERTIGTTERDTATSGGTAVDEDASDDDASGATTGLDPTPDDVAETFLELDDDLGVTPDTDATGGPRRGLVVGADSVAADAVPADYPLSATTDRAIALTVDFGDETTTVYLAWPGEGEETALTWLLEAMGIELRDLYGETVLVERTDGHDAIVAPAERPRGANRHAAVLGGLGTVAGFVGLLALTPGSVATIGPLLALVTFAALPYAVYTDAWYARTHSDWTGGPMFWATLAALPFLNLLAVAAYLLSRSGATFLREEPSPLERAVRRARSWL